MRFVKIPLDLSVRTVREKLSSPERVHGILASTLGRDDGEERPCRVLWRTEPDPKKNAVNLYVLTPVDPDLQVIADKFGLGDVPAGAAVLPYDKTVESIVAGGTYRFRLRANAVVGVSGSRVPHVGMQNRLEWLMGEQEDGRQRCERNWGFKVLGVPRQSFIRDERIGKTGHAKARLSSVQFDGLLLVTDERLFKRALTHGVGHGKAYGCGLLNVRAA